MYTTEITIYEEDSEGMYPGFGHSYYLETTEFATDDQIRDVIFEALEIESISYPGKIWVNIIRFKDGEPLGYIRDADESEFKIDIKLTDELTPYIRWDLCPHLPPIYKIDRLASKLEPVI